MRHYRLHPILTPARRRWLELLEQGPTRRWPNNRAASDCLSLGWTDWWVVDRATGEEMSQADYEAQRKDADEALAVGHCLTDTGRRMLELARKREDKP